MKKFAVLSRFRLMASREFNRNNSTLTELPRNDLMAAERIDHVIPNPFPSFNLASHVNKSELLQSLLKIGVSLHTLDKKEVHSWLLTLNFEENVKPIIHFLVDRGVSPDSIGQFLTKNPDILKTNLQTLETRTAYLHSKKFTNPMISQIYSRNPLWLQFEVEEIDSRLGFFQKTFHLSGNEIRTVVTRESRLITRDCDQIKLMNFGFREEMGFESRQIKQLLLAKPKLWIMNKGILVERFDYVHNVIGLDHETILRFPSILTCRQSRLKPRHEFLKWKNTGQYDPKSTNYVSPIDLIKDTDARFAVDIAKSSVQEFNDFCKTL